MNPWRAFPLLRLIFPVIAGTAAAIFPGRQSHVPIILIFSLFCLYSVIVLIGRLAPGYRYRWLPGVLILILVALLSYENAVRRNPGFSPSYFMKAREEGRGLFFAEIIEPPARKEKSIRVIVRIMAGETGDHWMKTEGKALVYVQKDSLAGKLFFGDRIIFRCEFKEPQAAGFPHSFDPRLYLSRRHIFHTAYIGSGNWKKIEHRGFSLKKSALLLRDRLLRIFQENGVGGREFAVAAALLLGYTDEIDRELIRDYSATGAMHILSVSGMHVGIIFLVLDRLLAFLRRSKSGIILRTVLIIFTVWLYAMMTGLSPAVMRASVMITFIVAGKAMKREPEVLNIVAASLIILIFPEPVLITDIGFQMSYLAVAGIVLLYKPVYDLYVTSRYLPDKIWAIVAVSLAAQLVTFPLGLFYFHQFPNYFMIANIIVVPLSTLVIYTGILLLFFGSVPFVSMLFAKGLTWLVWCLNQSVSFIEELPFSVSDGIFIRMPEMLLIYLLIVTILLYFKSRKKIYVFLFLGAMIAVQFTFFIHKAGRGASRSIIVYGAKNLSGIELVNGNRSIFISDHIISKDPFFLENRKNTLDGLGIRREMRLILGSSASGARVFSPYGWFSKAGRFVLFNGRKIGILDRKVPESVNTGPQLDYVIISGSPDLSLGQVNRIFGAKEIIADPTNKRWRVKKWMEEANENGVWFYSVSESGAFYRELDDQDSP